MQSAARVDQTKPNPLKIWQNARNEESLPLLPTSNLIITLSKRKNVTLLIICCNMYFCWLTVRNGNIYWRYDGQMNFFKLKISSQRKKGYRPFCDGSKETDPGWEGRCLLKECFAYYNSCVENFALCSIIEDNWGRSKSVCKTVTLTFVNKFIDSQHFFFFF